MRVKWIIVAAESRPDKKSTQQAQWPWKPHFLPIVEDDPTELQP